MVIGDRAEKAKFLNLFESEKPFSSGAVNVGVIGEKIKSV